MTESSPSHRRLTFPKEELAIDHAIHENAPEANVNQTEAQIDPTVAYRDFSEWHGKVRRAFDLCLGC